MSHADNSLKVDFYTRKHDSAVRRIFVFIRLTGKGGLYVPASRSRNNAVMGFDYWPYKLNFFSLEDVWSTTLEHA